MPYTKELYEKAMEIIKQRRLDAEKKHASKLRLFEELEPEYKTFKKVESCLNIPLENIVHFAVICQSNKVKHEYDKIKNISGINKFYSLGNDGYGLVEANELMATKTLGLEYIEKKYGFDTVIAFGNDGNDISMMKSASISVCPANGKNGIKETAGIYASQNY